MENVDAKKNLEGYIEVLKSKLPKTVSDNFFGDVENEWIANGEVIYSNGTFQLQTPAKGIFYAFKFTDEEASVSFTAITQDVEKSNRNKRQRTIEKLDNEFCVSVIESDLMIDNFHNNGIDIINKCRKEYDLDGNLVKENLTAHQEISCSGSFSELINKPFEKMENLEITNSYNKEYINDYQKAM